MANFRRILSPDPRWHQLETDLEAIGTSVAAVNLFKLYEAKVYELIKMSERAMTPGVYKIAEGNDAEGRDRTMIVQSIQFANDMKKDSLSSISLYNMCDPSVPPHTPEDVTPDLDNYIVVLRYHRREDIDIPIPVPIVSTALTLKQHLTDLWPEYTIQGAHKIDDLEDVTLSKINETFCRDRTNELFVYVSTHIAKKQRWAIWRERWRVAKQLWWDVGKGGDALSIFNELDYAIGYIIDLLSTQC
ncbi:hypothetical protein M408DRAFT_9760 [Serendipita vermifera MAFF 305830]|uniref:Uncharacterized protein n=1 Tax=Serendipita vermifera MAFF 305830 TaxID=933852 RepID=A0A0C2WK61_SERVB|nr:hypothetical protein M408DRAFT_9760 [Serendipita vermifera MAFF 305830]